MLSPHDLRRLQKDAAHFTSSHVTYLSEALRSLRRHEDPGATLALLVALWGTAYASRSNEKLALNDVGRWLEQRIQVPESAGDAPRIILEIAWLRRLARIAGADHGGEEQPRMKQARPLGPRRQTEHDGQAPIHRTFGLRQGPPVAMQSGRSTTPPGEAPWRRLPPLFEVEFGNFPDARTAHRTVLEREKKKQPPGEKSLALRPVDPDVRALAEGLTCTTATPGFRELFVEIHRRGGNAPRFFVDGVVEREGNPTAGKLLVARPDDSSTSA